MTGSPLEQVKRFVLPQDTAGIVLNVLARAGRRGEEAFVLLGGRPAAEMVLDEALCPDQSPMTTEHGLMVAVSGDALLDANLHFHRAGRTIAAQVHAHPGEAYHSEIDDAVPSSPFAVRSASSCPTSPWVGLQTGIAGPPTGSWATTSGGRAPPTSWRSAPDASPLLHPSTAAIDLVTGDGAETARARLQHSHATITGGTSGEDPGFAMSVNLAARLFPAIDLHADGKALERAADLATSINPNIELGPPSGDVRTVTIRHGAAAHDPPSAATAIDVRADGWNVHIEDPGDPKGRRTRPLR